MLLLRALRCRLTFLALGIVFLLTGCAPAAQPTATPPPMLKPASPPIDLVILYTSDTAGVVESRAGVGG